MAYEPKTKQTTASVAAYLAAIDDEARRKDCKALATMMKKATGRAPKMWGESIVGFDTYHYRYASGQEGDWPVLGFSARKGPISVYVSAGYDGAQDLLARLGKHKAGKACLYIKRLADVDAGVLEQLLAHGVAEIRRLYPTAA
jgi:Domain of unknown function (DU1801)